MPLVAQKNAKAYDAVICRGGNPRCYSTFRVCFREVTKGIAVGLNSGIPVVYGVITADTIEQAIERAGTKAGNKGVDAAITAIEMVNLLKNI